MGWRCEGSTIESASVVSRSTEKSEDDAGKNVVDWRNETERRVGVRNGDVGRDVIGWRK
jgi:hypothetical protein